MAWYLPYFTTDRFNINIGTNVSLDGISVFVSMYQATSGTQRVNALSFM
jgi:hypothetical protein